MMSWLCLLSVFQYDRLNQSYGATVNYAIQQANIMDAVSRRTYILLIYCGLVTPYGDMDLDQRWLR